MEKENKKNGFNINIRATSYQLPATHPGFTLVELIIVVGLIALLVLVSLSMNGNFLSETPLEVETNEIVEQIRLAHTRSLTRYQNSSWGIYFDPDGVNNDRIIVFKGTSYAARDANYDVITELPSSLSLQDIAFTGNGSEFVFDLSGKTTQSGTFSLVASASEGNTVTVNSQGVIFVEPITPMRVASGSYTGNGGDNRAIGGVGFQPDIVIIKGYNAQSAVMTTSSLGSDSSKRMTGFTAVFANAIQSLEADGFTIGSDLSVNASSIEYHWIAFKAGNGNLMLGTYTGNGTSQTIGGVGFVPEYVVVFGENASYAIQQSVDMPGRSYFFEGDLGNTNRITAMNSNGFTVGNSSTVNTSAVRYHYIAWNESSRMGTGSYVGNSVDNRNITEVGFRPDYVIIMPNSYGGTSHRPSALGGDFTLHFPSFLHEANMIQELRSDGFQLGTHGRVNTSGTTYYWMAFKDAED